MNDTAYIMAQFDYNIHKKASNSLYIAQLALQLFIDDNDNTNAERLEAMEIHRWLGNTQSNIDNIFCVCHNYGVFLLQVMKIYELNAKGTHSNFVDDFEHIRGSLEKQYDMYLQKEELLQKLALTAITDVNYRGYD